MCIHLYILDNVCEKSRGNKYSNRNFILCESCLERKINWTYNNILFQVLCLITQYVLDILIDYYKDDTQSVIILKQYIHNKLVLLNIGFIY